MSDIIYNYAFNFKTFLQTFHLNELPSSPHVKEYCNDEDEESNNPKTEGNHDVSLLIEVTLLLLCDEQWCNGIWNIKICQ